MKIKYEIDSKAVYSATKEYRHYFQLRTPEEEKANFNLDSILIDLLEKALEPYIGPSDGPSSKWFHSMDTYGDGVRLIETRPGHLNAKIIQTIQNLPQGEHKYFSVLWKEYENNPSTDDPQVEAALIRNDEIIATNGIVGLKKLYALVSGLTGRSTGTPTLPIASATPSGRPLTWR